MRLIGMHNADDGPLTTHCGRLGKINLSPFPQVSSGKSVILEE
jgi:hypothetical protein